MTQTKWFPTGNLAWRRIDEDALPSNFVYSRQFIDGICQDAGYELVQEVYEVDGEAPDNYYMTGKTEWRPIPILPAGPSNAVCAGFFQNAFTSPLLNSQDSEPAIPLSRGFAKMTDQSNEPTDAPAASPGSEQA